VPDRSAFGTQLVALIFFTGDDPIKMRDLLKAQKDLDSLRFKGPWLNLPVSQWGKPGRISSFQPFTLLACHAFQWSLSAI